MSESQTVSPAPRRARAPYVPAVGPRLKKLLYFVFVLVALLGANSAYLASITFLGWLKEVPYENSFYMWMLLGHVVVGLLMIAPVIVFGVIHMFNARKRKNRRAVRVGYALFAVAIVVLLTGLL